MLYLLMFVQLVISADTATENNISIIEGQKFTLSCPIKTVSRPGMFRWLFVPHGKEKYQTICNKPPGEMYCVKFKSNSWLSSIEINALTIVIEKVTYSNSGTYQCSYIDAKDLERFYFKVNVQTIPGKPAIHTSPLSLTENSLVTLSCLSIGGNPKPTLKWSWKDFSNNPISQERRINSSLIPSNSTYGLTTLMTTWLPKSNEDGNSISCQAENSLAVISSNWMYLNINYPPVIYDFPSKIYYGLLNSEVSIECKATSKSTATFKWTNEKGLVISDGSYLIINPLRSSDNGSYSCVVTNSVGTSSATLNIKVLSEPIIKVPNFVIVNEWESLNVVCDAVPPISNITWLHDDKVISNDKVLKYDINEKQSFEIQCLASVNLRSHAGHPVISRSKQTVMITVQHVPRKPSITANPTGTLLTGSDVTMTCNTNKSKPGLPKPEYFWSKKRSNWMRNGTNFLTLSVLKFDDSGMYSCKLFNSLGSSEESTHDVVIEGPPICNVPVSLSAQSLHTRVGRSFKIECRFQGHPEPSIKWYRNEILIKPNINFTRYNFQHMKINLWLISLLYVDEADTSAEESYRCLAENKYGSVSQEFVIKVIYPPRMISNVYILAANITGPLPFKDSININCSVIASPNINITWIRQLEDYSEKRIENETEKYLILERNFKDKNGIESILYITHFRNDDYGRYTCAAKNSEGEIKTNFEIRRFSLPDPPHDLIIESKSWSSLSLKWKAGFDGGYHQVFTVSYSTEMQKHPIQMRTRHTNITLMNLLPDMLYIVNVSSSNELGTCASTLSKKAKTAELLVDQDQIFSINRDEKTIEFSLPSNLSGSVFCLTIEQMDIQKDLVGDWMPLQKCIKTGLRKIKIENPYDRFRVKICLVNFPDVCSNSINQRLDGISTDALVSTRLIGTVAAICTALVIVLAILLFFILIRSRRFLPGISDLKVIKRNRKSSYSKDDQTNFNLKSPTPMCPKKLPFMKDPGGCPLLSTYSCDQVHMPGNPIEILNVCPPHNLFMEGLYSTLVKSSSISPFPFDLAPQTDGLHQQPMNNASSCCCHDDQQIFSMSLPASRINKPDKIIYEVMV